MAQLLEIQAHLAILIEPYLGKIINGEKPLNQGLHKIGLSLLRALLVGICKNALFLLIIHPGMGR